MTRYKVVKDEKDYAPFHLVDTAANNEIVSKFLNETDAIHYCGIQNQYERNYREFERN